MVAARYLPFMGGIETHIHEVSARMAAFGHSVTVLTTDPTGKLPAFEDAAGVRIIRVRAWPKNSDYYFSLGIFARLLTDEWDIIHFQGYNTFVAPIGLLAAIRGRTPFVLTFHSGGHSSSLRKAVRPLQHALLRPLIRRCAQLIAVSQFEADFFSARMGIARNRFVVVPNGAWLPPPSTVAPERSETEDGGPLIVSIGRLERYKGHHRAIEAMPELLRLVPNARLRIAGSGPYEPSLRRLAHQLGVADRVRIEAVPSSDRRQLSDLLNSAALVVLLSEYEAHPVAIMEALSLHRPTLVGDATGLRELAQKGLCRSIPLGARSRAVAAAMVEAMTAPPAALQMALPDWEGCARDLLGIYRRVLGGANTDAPAIADSGLGAAQPGS
jgi:glycosyltransferase involved in cell wall biosynthesis